MGLASYILYTLFYFRSEKLYAMYKPENKEIEIREDQKGDGHCECQV